MARFSVFLDKEGAPKDIFFEGAKFPWRVNPSDSGISAEADWLCLLALHTAHGRAVSQDSEYCPCLSELDQGHTKTIAGSVYDRRNFEKPRQLEIPVGDDGDYAKNAAGEVDDQRHWLVKVFDKPPVDLFLAGSKSPRVERIRFTKEVEVSVLGFNSVSSGRKESIQQPEILNKILRKFERTLKGLEKSLSLKIEIDDPFSKEALGQIIDSRNCQGRLKAGQRFWLSVDATYETEFAVFWVPTDGKVVSLYPHQNFTLSSEDVAFEKAREKTQLRLGEYCKFRVHPPEGFDLCVVLTRGKSYSRAEVEDFRLSLEKVVTPPNLVKKLCQNDRPTLRKISVVRKRSDIAKIGKGKVSTKRFGPSEKPIGWVSELTSVAEGKAEVLCFFEVPNQQS